MAITRNLTVLCCTLITLSVVILLPSTAFSQTWHIEVVDSDSLVGWHLSLALDSNDFPAISYHNTPPEHLKFARWNGSSWDLEVVDSPGEFAWFSSLALDSSGFPAISYCNGDLMDAEVKVARWSGSAWDIEVVDSGYIASLALDSNGYPTVSYHDHGSRNLKFARWNGSAWGIEVVDSGGPVGHHTSLALDSNGYPAISYLGSPDGTFDFDLKFARWNGFFWDLEVVDSYEHSGEGSNSLALDSNGYPAIAYYHDPNRDLKFARWNGSSWDLEVVDSDGYVSGSTSLALDSNDYPAISYYVGDANEDLKFARWNGSSWDIEVVDAGGDVGGSNSLELDSNGYPAIAYHDHTNEALKFARYLPPKVFRGCVNTAVSDWKSTWLPLTENSDDEAPPFPVVTSIPGEVFDDNFPCQEASADLLFYRVLIGGTTPAGNILRAEKVPTGVKLSF